jgi:hypothetical protein
MWTDAKGKIINWNLSIRSRDNGIGADTSYTTYDTAFNFVTSDDYGLDNFATPGKWTPDAFSFTNGLLGTVHAMNIPKQGTSLIDQLTTVLTDINNGTLGLACSDLQIFANHVKAQTGKGITTAQATTIMQYVAAISAGIPGCQVH